jgi:hypothetical protein
MWWIAVASRVLSSRAISCWTLLLFRLEGDVYGTASAFCRDEENLPSCARRTLRLCSGQAHKSARPHIVRYSIIFKLFGANYD